MSQLPDRPPELADSHAVHFWERHVPPLWADGTLTARDLESFTLLCQVWGRLQQLATLPPGPENYRGMVQYTNLLKQYQQLASRYGLLGAKGRPPAKKMTLQEVIRKSKGEATEN